MLAERIALGSPVWLCSIHSFTPLYLGRARPMEVGVLFDREELGEEEAARVDRLMKRMEVRRAIVGAVGVPRRAPAVVGVGEAVEALDFAAIFLLAGAGRRARKRQAAR